MKADCPIAVAVAGLLLPVAAAGQTPNEMTDLPVWASTESWSFYASLYGYFTTYVFNLGWTDPTVVLAMGLKF